MASTHSFDYPAEKARQGSIILRKPWQRVVFFGGLALPIVLLLLATLFPGVLHLTSDSAPHRHGRGLRRHSGLRWPGR